MPFFVPFQACLTANCRGTSESQEMGSNDFHGLNSPKFHFVFRLCSIAGCQGHFVCHIPESQMNPKLRFKVGLLSWFILAQQSLFGQEVSTERLQQIDSLNASAYYFLSLNTDSAEFFNLQALELSQQQGYKRGRSEALYHKAYLHSYRGDYENAVRTSLEALPDALREGSVDLTSGIYYLLGESYRELGLYSRSADYFLRAVEFDKIHGGPKDISFAYNNLGYLSMEIGDIEQAKMYFDKAMEIYVQMDYGFGKGTTYLNLAEYYLKLNKTDTAIALLNLSEPLLRQDSDVYQVGYVQYFRGQIYAKADELDSAAFYYRKALEATSTNNFVDLRLHTLIGLAEMYLLQENPGQAAHSQGQQFALDGILLAEETKNLKRLKEFRELLLAVALRENNIVKIDSARAALQQVHELMLLTSNRSLGSSFSEMADLFQKEQEVDLVTLEMKDLEASRSRIVWLSVLGLAIFSVFITVILVLYNRSKAALKKIEDQNKELDKQKAQLAGLLDFQKSITRIITHDMRGPLSNLQMLLLLFFEDKNYGDEERMVYAKIGASLDQVNILLEDLVGRLYLEDPNARSSKETILIAKAVEETTLLLNQLLENKRIELQVNVDPQLQILVQPLLFNTIVRNLLYNAVKFTGTGGKIEVKAYKYEEGVTIEVADTGVGMNERTIKKILDANRSLTSTPGTSGEKGIGMGLQIVLETLKLHGSELHVKSEEGKGSVFSFTIKQ